MQNVKYFVRLLKPYRPQLAAAGAALIIANLLGLFLPWAVKLIIDEVIGNNKTSLLGILLLALVGAAILKFVFNFCQEYLVAYMGEHLVSDMRGRLYWQVNKLSVEYVEKTQPGSVISGIIGDVDSLKDFMLAGALDFVYSFFSVLLVLIVLVALDWRLALIAFIFAPMFAITFLKLTPKLKQTHARVRQGYAELTERLHDGIAGMRVTASFAQTNREIDGFNAHVQDIAERSLAGHRISLALWMGSELISSLGLVTLLWFGSQAVLSGRITVGTLIAFYSYLSMLFYPVIRMAVINNYFQEASASLERIRKIFSRVPAVRDHSSARRLEKCKGVVRFEHVCFSYDNVRDALKDITFEIPAKKTVAITGKSGAGKTTLVNLMLRFYDPSKGSILVDGYPLEGLSLDSYRARIALVPQDDYFFSASVRENIRFSRPGAADHEVEEAARTARCHEFIARFADGYDTRLGQRGLALSAGQRQRVSIARAILRDPAILILDEATAHIDSVTERSVIDSVIARFSKDRTVVIITHGFSLLEHADIIVVLDAGMIAESGTHKELIRAHGAYWEMWNSRQCSGAMIAQTATGA